MCYRGSRTGAGGRKFAERGIVDGGVRGFLIIGCRLPAFLAAATPDAALLLALPRMTFHGFRAVLPRPESRCPQRAMAWRGVSVILVV